MKLLLSVLLALAAAPAWPQSQYSEDLTECFTAFKSLIARAEKLSPGNKAGKLGIQAEVVQLQVHLSKLSRETAQANLALARSGEEHDSNLLLIGSGADSLLLAEGLLLHYLYTNARVFLIQANAAAAIARSLRDSTK